MAYTRCRSEEQTDWGSQVQQDYYISRKPELLKRFDQEAQRWRPVMAAQYGDDFAETILKEAHQQFEILIPQLPYIGGDENQLTHTLIDSAGCLALYEAMKAQSRTAEETGKVLYDAVMSRLGEPLPDLRPDQRLTEEQLMERRRERAQRTQLRRYPQNWVYEFVQGEGEHFDYGYNFTECGTQKLYHAQGADELLPFFCFLDFAWSHVLGLGLSRTMTLGEGHGMCDHRFKKGRESEQDWPPPFLRPATRRQG